jgi:sugar transferase EpsL
MPVTITARKIPACKRILDLLLTLIGLIILSPFMVVIALLILFSLGWPIFYTQPRPGLGARIFHICKFRTMRNIRGDSGKLLPDAQRMTSLGRFLRASSLDELPELFNILAGQMSLVGPRPLLVQYLERYTPKQLRRQSVLPGITGWAQVNGRNAISWEDKFRLDVWYVDHWSFWLDIKILFITLWKVVSVQGINQPGQTTAAEFKGSQAVRSASGPKGQGRSRSSRG